MSDYSSYKRLELPEATEKYNVQVFNKNNTIIDSELHKLDLKNESQDNLLATKEALNLETSRATTKENEITKSLSDEITRSKTSENDIKTALSEEISRATSAEKNNRDNLIIHMSDKENPHVVTKEQIDLGNVDNTSDINKPISIAQQNALDAVLLQSNQYTDTKIADLIDGAPETLDTLKEVADALTEHANSLHAPYNATIVEKSNNNGNVKINGMETTVYTHPNGTNPHGTTKADLGLDNVGNFKAVSTEASQGLTDSEKANARNNIGAGTSSFSGNYNDLSNKPTIPATVAVKGNAESSYRTGNVNLTPANIGAFPSGGGHMTGSNPYVGFQNNALICSFGSGGKAQFALCNNGWDTEGLKTSLYIGGTSSSDNLWIFPRTNDGDNLWYLGASNCRWKAIYAVNGTIQTSDKNYKKDIFEFDERFVKDFIMGLRPVTYKMKDGDSGRVHYGMISQDVEKLLSDLGITSMDFAGFIKSPKNKMVDEYDENGNIKSIDVEEIPGEYVYSLRYDEFISPLIKMVQIQQKEIEELKLEVELLKFSK